MYIPFISVVILALMALAFPIWMTIFRDDEVTGTMIARNRRRRGRQREYQFLFLTFQ